MTNGPEHVNLLHLIEHISSINEKKGYLYYEFNTRNDAEMMDVELQIYQPNNVRLNINSSHRTFMKYEGRLKWLEVEEE